MYPQSVTYKTNFEWEKLASHHFGEGSGVGVVRFPNPLDSRSGLGERTPKKEVF